LTYTKPVLQNKGQQEGIHPTAPQSRIVKAWGLEGPQFMAKILCVDDEPHVVTLKCAILESAGHSVTACTSAREAIEKLRQNAYDAVVTDWRLGDANGRAIVQAAKDHSSMPVVVVSGYVAEAFQAAEPLADLYLEKPVNPEELVTIVNELLKTGEKAATSTKQNR
jgi:DNA-binding response OmpR family regulator